MTKYHSLQSIVNFRVGIGFTPLLFIALFVGVSGCGQQVAEQARQQAEAALEEARAAEAGAEQLRQELEELKKNSEEQAETNQETAEAEPDGSKRSPKTEPGTESEPAPKEESATPKAASAVAADDVEPVGAVDDEDLLTAQDNNANWLMYGRTYNSQRYSGLDQINKDNVSDLLPVWTFQTGVLDGFECTPLVVDGIMYITTPWNHAYAIDCKTGSQLWHYQKSLPENMALCCDAVNRGFAVYGENLYMSTLDAHLVCLDKNTGEEIWDTAITAYNENGEEEQDIYKMAYSATVAPLVIKGKVIIGISGAEYGIRGFIDAYNAETGERQWRFYTVPAEDDEAEHAKEALKSWGESSWLTGGGSAWVTGTYDAELNTLYWGIGNPSPDFNGEVRKGDNLYTCSIVALNPDDGTYKWHFQNSPHDVWDYDGVNTPVLVDIERDGQQIKALVQAHRNGYFYCLNRENGEFIYGKPFCEVTWTDRTKGADGLDPKTGRPFVSPDAMPTEEGVRVCPGAAGGKEWNPMAYHPGTGLAYIPVIENCAKFTSGKAFYIKGQPYWGSSLTLIDGEASGALRAIDAATGEIKWDVATRSPMVAGVLTTAGGLVLTGDAEGFLTAYDAGSGEDLWHFQCGSGHHASPITYTLDGKQYLAVCVGWGGWTAGFAGDGAPWLRDGRRGNTLFVFALPN
ncbi:MAG TPA: PQQ-dependent dehydrogenase, methanol/ethanol family [Pirellulaceae bacterium]|nr:PQQ-dependent dehydrogenase, methanol/ethanol family [Pirellulaceae bacterium]